MHTKLRGFVIFESVKTWKKGPGLVMMNGGSVFLAMSWMIFDAGLTGNSIKNPDRRSGFLKWC